MLRQAVALVSVVCISVLPMTVGCDRTVESERDVKVKDDGTRVERSKTVTENDDGTVRKTENTDVDRPNP